MKPFLLSTFVISLFAIFPVLHASGGLPQTNVCPEMERVGEDMLRGDPHSFYFVDALQGTFPIPRFFVVSGVEGSGDIRLTGWALPYEEHEELESMDIHAHSNVCDWTMTISYGPVENVSSIIEGTSGGHELIAEYSTPRLRVIHVRLQDVESVSTVIAHDERRHISFTQRDANKALWLLRLYEELSVEP
ncbi:MAG: hypothetical protein JJU06_21235 [Ectothiorhodospiraceae bacterium]|nr:hypothetical protein [Ectothiorhodospiraceae bacterium]MCH8505023.1 hypothetical protein [Ectothiorhodospiraceae bacterium]